MAQIYIDQTAPIKTKIFWGGEIIAADDDVVTATIYDVTGDQTLDPLVLSTDDLDVITATKLDNDEGTYQIVIPFQFCQRNRTFKIVWEYQVDGTEASHSQYVDVVTPYVNLSDAWDQMNVGTDPSDPNYKTYYEMQLAERYARKLIEDFTEQSFYLYDDKQVVYGFGSDILPLPYKINSIHKLYENDVLLVDNINDVDNWVYSPVISESGYGIRVNRQELTDNVVYTANGMVPPTIYDRGDGSSFRDGYRYTVEGRFGWSKVPSDIQEACIVLMKQFFEKDTEWRNKYVKSISAFDWKFEYTGAAQNGTGNLYADKLLSPYVVTSMVAI
jgi:hypothetical protein